MVSQKKFITMHGNMSIKFLHLMAELSPDPLEQ